MEGCLKVRGSSAVVLHPAPEDLQESSAYDQYMKYYKEALARHTAKT